jgi:3',5'-cyclic AMP phosphodiesterase CpdA
MLPTTTIAHLTDVHLSPVAGLLPRYWNTKRALGLANWLRHRERAHDRGVLHLLERDLGETAPDHIVVTGDLTNLGLPWEHQQALVWLTGLGPPARVSVIPGNHDIYTRIGRDEGTLRWQPFMHSDSEGRRYAPVEWGFPYVRIVGRVAIVGLNSAIETPPLIAAGALGEGQRDRLRTVLRQLATDGLFRLVMIHHPPLPGLTSPARALKDALAMRDVLIQAGAELVIHGHNHVAHTAWLRATGRVIPIVAGASASLGSPHKHETLARYNLYRISGPPWHVELQARGLARQNGPVEDVFRQALVPAPTH